MLDPFSFNQLGKIRQQEILEEAERNRDAMTFGEMGRALVSLIANGWQTMDDPANPGTKLLFTDNHYQDMLWNTGISQNENIASNGGSDKASYNVAFGYSDQKGIFVGTKYKRYDALSNFSFKASENFKIDVMVNYQNVIPNYVDGYQNELVRGVRITPLIRIFKDDGNPTPGELYTVRNRFHTPGSGR